MAVCDLCGASGKLVKAKVEGTLLTVCSSCARYGSVLDAPPPRPAFRKRSPSPLPISREMVVEDYATLVKQARERKGLTQEDLAKHISEKLSLIHKVETGHMEPSIPFARKLEKFLHITLVDEEEDSDEPMQRSSSASFTVADAMKK